MQSILIVFASKNAKYIYILQVTSKLKTAIFPTVCTTTTGSSSDFNVFGVEIVV